MGAACTDDPIAISAVIAPATTVVFTLEKTKRAMKFTPTYFDHVFMIGMQTLCQKVYFNSFKGLSGRIIGA